MCDGEVTTWSALIRLAADTSQTRGTHMLHQESQCLAVQLGQEQYMNQSYSLSSLSFLDGFTAIQHRYFLLWTNGVENTSSCWNDNEQEVINKMICRTCSRPPQIYISWCSRQSPAGRMSRTPSRPRRSSWGRRCRDPGPWSGHIPRTDHTSCHKISWSGIQLM